MTLFEILVMIGGLVSIGYYLVLKIMRRRVSFARFFAFAGLLLFLYGLLHVMGWLVLPDFLLWLVRIVLILFLISFVWVERRLVLSAHEKKPESLDALIILGAGLFGDRLSLSLKRRLDEALRVGQDHPQVIFIVCGGQGPDEWISEAQAMHDYLVAHGISSERILQEDQSTSTYENLSFAISRFDLSGWRVGIVTNSFHLCRSVRMARQLGLEAYGFGTSAPHLTSPVFYTREYFAYLKAKIKGQI